MDSSLTYNSETGWFLRNGKRAGSSDCTKGYRRVMWNKKVYKEHRLAWYFHYGKWPVGQIDHLNGIKDDNRICNLRDVSQSTNMYNKFKCHAHNTTGYLGVSRSGYKFVARLRVNNKLIHLGSFTTPEEANQHYKEFKELVELERSA